MSMVKQIPVRDILARVERAVDPQPARVQGHQI
jgi:hypothetical protein